MKYGLYILSITFVFLIGLGIGINHYRKIALKKAQLSESATIEELIPSAHDCIWVINNVDEVRRAENLLPVPLRLNDWEINLLHTMFDCAQDDFPLFADECWWSASSNDLNSRLIMMKAVSTDPLLHDRFLKRIFEKEAPIEEKIGDATVYYQPLSGDRFLCAAFFKNIWLATTELNWLRMALEREASRQMPKQLPDWEERDFLTFWHFDEEEAAGKDDETVNKRKYAFRRHKKGVSVKVTGTAEPLENNTLFAATASVDTTVYLFDRPDTTISWVNYGWPLQITDRDDSDDQTFWRSNPARTKKILEYFNTCVAPDLLSVDFVADGKLRQLYLLEVRDSTLAFDTFRKEMKLVGGLHYLHYRWIDRHTYYIYELAHPDFLYSFFSFPRLKSRKGVEYVTFYKRKMLVADSLESLETYLKKVLLSPVVAENMRQNELERSYSMPCGMIDNRYDCWADSVDNTVVLQQTLGLLPLPLVHAVWWQLQMNNEKQYELQLVSE